MIWLQPNRLASAYRWYSKLPFDKYSKLCGDKFLRDRKKLHKIRSTWTVIFSNRFSLKPNLSIKSKTLDWKYSSHYIIAFFLHNQDTLCQEQVHCIRKTTSSSYGYAMWKLVSEGICQKRQNNNLSNLLIWFRTWFSFLMEWMIQRNNFQWI